jgi:hypothetical protein
LRWRMDRLGFGAFQIFTLDRSGTDRNGLRDTVTTGLVPMESWSVASLPERDDADAVDLDSTTGTAAHGATKIEHDTPKVAAL